MTEEMGGTDGQRPLLTIAIPTFNRARFLKELLSTLFDQLIEEPRVELIISDNDSTDETPSLVEEYRQRGLRFRYTRNEVNIGADANFVQCFELAQGRYFLLLGDDDYITPGGVAKILEAIESAHSYDLIYLVPRYYENISSDKSKVARRAGRYRVVNNPIDFSRLVNAAGDLIFISSMVINKDNIPEVTSASCADMLESNVVQLAWVFTALRKMKSGLYADDFILYGGAAPRLEGRNVAKVFVVNYLHAMELWIGENETQLKSALTDDLIVFWFRNWVWLRKCTGSASTKESVRTVQVLSGDRMLSSRRVKYLIFVFSLVCLPLTLAYPWNRMLAVARKVIKYRRLSYWT